MIICRISSPLQPMTNKHLTASFGFLHDVYLLINISQVLGKKEDTDIYTALYRKLAEEFHRVFFNTSLNFYGDETQAAQVFALALSDVVPANVRETVVIHLVTGINQKGNHVSIGLKSIHMFNNPYENATTLWELWNTPTTGLDMNSRNHIKFGSGVSWFYSHLAGIDFSSNMITIQPRMVSESKKHLMSKLHCQLSTLYGLLHVSYTRDEGDTVLNSILLLVTILIPNPQARYLLKKHNCIQTYVGIGSRV